jgi:hypothetical protein
MAKLPPVANPLREANRLALKRLGVLFRASEEVDRVAKTKAKPFDPVATALSIPSGYNGIRTVLDSPEMIQWITAYVEAAEKGKFTPDYAHLAKTLKAGNPRTPCPDRVRVFVKRKHPALAARLEACR